MIASIAFRNFKALRNARIQLERFNLVIGPNGSGKSSLIESLMRLRTLARLPLSNLSGGLERHGDGPEVSFHFFPPFDGWEAVMMCATEQHCDLLQAIPLPAGGGVEDWPTLREHLLRIRRYEFDHTAIGRPSLLKDGDALSIDGGNLAAILARWQDSAPGAFSGWRSDVLRTLPEYEDISVTRGVDGRASLRFSLVDHGESIAGEDLSQGSLYALAIFALANDPDPPAMVCIEELDRGLHPRLLREARDALYRLSYPETAGLSHAPVQVIATTYSPYLLDLFRDHPEEVVVAQKHGRAAHFTRLCERSDLGELMAGASLGDLWYSGILGGVPDEAAGTFSRKSESDNP